MTSRHFRIIAVGVQKDLRIVPRNINKNGCIRHEYRKSHKRAFFFRLAVCHERRLEFRRRIERDVFSTHFQRNPRGRASFHVADARD